MISSLGDAPYARREQWLRLCRELVDAALMHAPVSTGSIMLPGEPSKHGERLDGIEGFARVFLLFAFGEASGSSPFEPEHREYFAAGLEAGVAVDRHTAWPEATPKAHTIVDAATIALALRVLGNDFWQSVDELSRLRLERWLLEHALVETPTNNWVLFRLCVQSFLASIGRRDPRLDALAVESRAAADTWFDDSTGWYSDGDAGTYDYYNAFEWHFIPPLLAALDADTGAVETYGSRLSTFLANYQHLIDRGGRPVYQGRSLTYRFALGAPFALGALLERSPIEPPAAGALASHVLDAFLSRGAREVDGTLGRGWFENQPELAQDYAGPGAAYFAAKAFVALLLPAQHPFWSADDNVTSRVKPPRLLVLPHHPHWLIEPSIDRDVAVLVNHGSTERVQSVMRRAFSQPLYDRLAYSSATAPAETDGVGDRSFTVFVDGEPCSRGVIEPALSGEQWLSSRSHPRRRAGLVEAAAHTTLRGTDLQHLVMHQLTVVTSRWHIDACAVVGDLESVQSISYGGWALADGRSHTIVPRRGLPAPTVSTDALLSATTAVWAPRATGEILQSRSASPFGRSSSYPVVTMPVTEKNRTDGVVWMVGASALTNAGRPALESADRPRASFGARPSSDRAPLIRADGLHIAITLSDQGLRAEVATSRLGLPR